MLRSTLFVAVIFSSVAASGQTPYTAYQWTTIDATMRDLIAKGYTLTTVLREDVSGGAINTFYLSAPNDVVRCGEAYHVARLHPAVFPCERLIQPR